MIFEAFIRDKSFQLKLIIFNIIRIIHHVKNTFCDAPVIKLKLDLFPITNSPN